MFFKSYLIASILGLALFGYGQSKGISLFDKEAAPQTAQGAKSGQSLHGGRLSHK